MDPYNRDGVLVSFSRTMYHGVISILSELQWRHAKHAAAQGVHYKLKLNSVALVRERTIPTERPPPVGEVSANFCG